MEPVHVNGNEKVGLGLIGNLGPFNELGVYVRFAGIDHLHIGNPLFDVGSQLQGDGQNDVLFLAILSHGSRILASVSCIDHHRVDAIPLGGIFVHLHRKHVQRKKS